MTDPVLLGVVEVCEILDVTRKTIYNRERSGKYPQARRNASGYRIYTIDEVVALQLLTIGQVDPRRIASVLYDMGYTDPQWVSRTIAAATDRAKAAR